MKLANTEKDYAQIMATEAEKKIKSYLKEAVDLRGQLQKRLDQLSKELNRKVTVKELKKPEKFPNTEIAERAGVLYRRLQDSTDEIKALNRGLGGLVSTNPEFYADEGLLDEILNVEPGRNDKLEAVLQKWDSKMSYYGKKIKSKVGHHPTALSTLREALLKKDVNYRQAFKKMAEEQGYQIGEEFIRYIDPAAHKSFGTRIQGLLKEKGITLEGNEALFKELQDRMAHAWWSGSTAGTSAAPEALAGADVAKGLANVEPNLILDQTGTASSENIENILNRWSKKDFSGKPQDAINDLVNTLRRHPVPKVKGVWDQAAQITKSLGPLENPSQHGLVTDSRVNKLFPNTMQMSTDGAAAATLEQPNLLDNVLNQADNTVANLFDGANDLLNRLKLQGFKTLMEPDQFAKQLSNKYGRAATIAMFLDPNFKQQIKDGNYSDAATRLIIEEAIGDAVFKVGSEAWKALPPKAKLRVGALMSTVGLPATVIGGAAYLGHQINKRFPADPNAKPFVSGRVTSPEALTQLKAIADQRAKEDRWSSGKDQALENVRGRIEKEFGKGAIYDPKNPPKSNTLTKPKPKPDNRTPEQKEVEAQYGGPPSERPWGLGT